MRFEILKDDFKIDDFEILGARHWENMLDEFRSQHGAEYILRQHEPGSRMHLMPRQPKGILRMLRLARGITDSYFQGLPKGESYERHLAQLGHRHLEQSAERHLEQLAEMHLCLTFRHRPRVAKN